MSDPQEAPTPSSAMTVHSDRGRGTWGRIALLLALFHLAALSAAVVAEAFRLGPVPLSPGAMSTMMAVAPPLQAAVLLLAISTLVVGLIALGDRTRVAAAMAVGSAGSALILYAAIVAGIVLRQALGPF